MSAFRFRLSVQSLLEDDIGISTEITEMHSGFYCELAEREVEQYGIALMTASLCASAPAPILSPAHRAVRDQSAPDMGREKAGRWSTSGLRAGFANVGVLK